MDTTNIQLSICGHAKCGKSTLAGRLAFELKAIEITPEKIKKLAELAKLKNNQLGSKDFNKFNLIFLPNAPISPREGGDGAIKSPSRTQFPVRGSIKFNSTRLTLIDTPGHEKFANNMAYGIYSSDSAIVLVEIESDKNEVKIGTERVCRLLKAFDVKVVAFCITKMDRVNYSKDRFNEAEELIKISLIDKYKLDSGNNIIPIIPISALSDNGECIVESTEISTPSMPWYKGPSLLSVIKKLEKPTGDQRSKPLRIAIEGPNEIYSPQGVGTVLIGTLEAGLLKVGQYLVAEPSSTIEGKKIVGRVKSIQISKGVVQSSIDQPSEIYARAIVSIAIPEWTKEMASIYFRHGGILGLDDDRPMVAKKIKALVLFFEKDCVYHGKEYMIQPHVSSTMGRFLNIRSQIGVIDLTKEDYDSSENNEWIEADIEFKQPFCIEEASKIPRLSRFSISESNRIIGCGKCVKVFKTNPSNEGETASGL